DAGGDERRRGGGARIAGGGWWWCGGCGGDGVGLLCAPWAGSGFLLRLVSFVLSFGQSPHDPSAIKSRAGYRVSRRRTAVCPRLFSHSSGPSKNIHLSDH